MLHQLQNQVLQLCHVTSLPIAPSFSHIVHLLDSCHILFVILLQIGENIPRPRQALCHVDNVFLLLRIKSTRKKVAL